jgi:succinate dehydrogenase/fumarate reductase cytochrome b subunit
MRAAGASAYPRLRTRAGILSRDSEADCPTHAIVTTIVILILLAAILYNLGAGLYFMMTDRGSTNRTVRSLTWRIGLSVLLILLVIVGILTGVIKPHGIGQ